LDSIAHYKILERVGESPLGELFRARDTRLGRTVAIKVLPESLQADRARRDALFADARTAMTLSHPNIAALYEAGDDNGRAFLACEFVPGEPLDRVIAGHPLNPRRAIDLTVQIADALADAHAGNMAHGNLTPDAIVVTPKGNAKILDFGFSKWTRTDGRPGDEAGDVRALERLFYQMLTGRPPSDERVAPTTVNKSLPAEVDAIALKTYELAVTLSADLRSVAAILEVRAEAADKSRSIPVRRKSRSKGPWIAAILFVLAAAVSAAWWFLLR
jgi:serine/threonine protein kinase